MIRSGTVLVAPPHIRDTRFSESVILIAQGSEQGHWGLCVNKALHITVKDLFRPAGLEVDIEREIYWGGPVNQGVIWMLHDSQWHQSYSLSLDADWSMTSHKRMFDDLDPGSMPRAWRMFSGFSAWAPGQLESEIQGQHPWSPSSSWLIYENFCLDEIFAGDDREIWKNCIDLCGQHAVSSWF